MPTETLEEVLAHHGVKGMHWGVRRSKIEIANDPASEDHTQAAAVKTKATANKGTHVLSNEELQTIITRINLEQQYSRLNPVPVTRGTNFMNGFRNDTRDVLRQTAKSAAKDQLSRRVAAELEKRAPIPKVGK